MRVIEKLDITPIEPILCSIKAGEKLIGHSRRFIIDAIARGKIEAVKSERRTLLVYESLKKYAANLQATSRAKGTINPRPRRRVAEQPTL